MTEILLFTLVAVALYFAADWALRAIEEYRGTPFRNRQIIFFVIILVLALVSFEVIGRLLRAG